MKCYACGTEKPWQGEASYLVVSDTFECRACEAGRLATQRRPQQTIDEWRAWFKKENDAGNLRTAEEVEANRTIANMEERLATHEVEWSLATGALADAGTVPTEPVHVGIRALTARVVELTGEAGRLTARVAELEAALLGMVNLELFVGVYDGRTLDRAKALDRIKAARAALGAR
jgi:hypothetical protein